MGACASNVSGGDDQFEAGDCTAVPKSTSICHVSVTCKSISTISGRKATFRPALTDLCSKARGRTWPTDPDSDSDDELWATLWSAADTLVCGTLTTGALAVPEEDLMCTKLELKSPRKPRRHSASAVFLTAKGKTDLACSSHWMHTLPSLISHPPVAPLEPALPPRPFCTPAPESPVCRTVSSVAHDSMRPANAPPVPEPPSLYHPTSCNRAAAAAQTPRATSCSVLSAKFGPLAPSFTSSRSPSLHGHSPSSGHMRNSSTDPHRSASGRVRGKRPVRPSQSLGGLSVQSPQLHSLAPGAIRGHRSVQHPPAIRLPGATALPDIGSVGSPQSLITCVTLCTPVTPPPDHRLKDLGSAGAVFDVSRVRVTAPISAVSVQMPTNTATGHNLRAHSAASLFAPRSARIMARSVTQTLNEDRLHAVASVSNLRMHSSSAHSGRSEANVMGHSTRGQSAQGDGVRGMKKGAEDGAGHAAAAALQLASLHAAITITAELGEQPSEGTRWVLESLGVLGSSQDLWQALNTSPTSSPSPFTLPAFATTAVACSQGSIGLAARDTNPMICEEPIMTTFTSGQLRDETFVPVCDFGPARDSNSASMVHVQLAPVSQSSLQKRSFSDRMWMWLRTRVSLNNGGESGSGSCLGGSFQILPAAPRTRGRTIRADARSSSAGGAVARGAGEGGCGMHHTYSLPVGRVADVVALQGHGSQALGAHAASPRRMSVNSRNGFQALGQLSDGSNPFALPLLRCARRISFSSSGSVMFSDENLHSSPYGMAAVRRHDTASVTGVAPEFPCSGSEGQFATPRPSSLAMPFDCDESLALSGFFRPREGSLGGSRSSLGMQNSSAASASTMSAMSAMSCTSASVRSSRASSSAHRLSSRLSSRPTSRLSSRHLLGPSMALAMNNTVDESCALEHLSGGNAFGQCMPLASVRESPRSPMS